MRGGSQMANTETELAGIAYVMELERQANRQPEDVHLKGLPYDVYSAPRKIEVKAFGGSARGAAIPLEDRQVKESRQDPANYYVYIVDNITRRDQIALRVLHGQLLATMLDRTAPHITYWPTLRVSDYDRVPVGLQ
jgi:Protein NO VEIN, C-terminal